MAWEGEEMKPKKELKRYLDAEDYSEARKLEALIGYENPTEITVAEFLRTLETLSSHFRRKYHKGGGVRTFEQAQEEAMPTPEEPTDFFASCFECKASWESFEELKQEFMALGGDGTRIPHCPRCLHDW